MTKQDNKTKKPLFFRLLQEVKQPVELPTADRAADFLSELLKDYDNDIRKVALLLAGGILHKHEELSRVTFWAFKLYYPPKAKRGRKPKPRGLGPKKAIRQRLGAPQQHAWLMPTKEHAKMALEIMRELGCSAADAARREAKRCGLGEEEAKELARRTRDLKRVTEIVKIHE